VQYKNVVTRELLPDFIMSPFFRKPYSTTSLIQLGNLESALKNVEIISCIEFISFISAQCAKISKKSHKKLVVSVFETLTSIHKVPIYKWNVKSVLSTANLFIAYSKRSVDYLRYLSVDEDKIRMIYLGIDLEKFNPQLAKRSDEKLRVLFVGAYARQKGLSILLPAFARLCKKVPDCELWLVISQGGEDEGLVREYSKKFPIKIFHNLKYDELPKIYASCDIFCLPSLDWKKWGMKLWEEQFGFVLIEAMASGLPIVGSDCGSIPEIIGPSNPTVIQGSQDKLFLALLKMALDENFRKRLSKLNRSRSEHFFDIIKQRQKLEKTLLESFE
jgi:glycosyltransferase involved in cell wall biosynthesis|tara:strand:- start:5876 stop:6868 length:993 start_codon:yes stop_codon:yes gene_type:complete